MTEVVQAENSIDIMGCSEHVPENFKFFRFPQKNLPIGTKKPFNIRITLAESESRGKQILQCIPLN